MSDSDTIAAIATAPGEGGVAIVRVSGARAFDIADAVFSCRAPPPSRRPGGTFVFGNVIEADGSVLDEALLLLMRAPRSYTREDTIEIQGHGGPVVTRRILQRVIAAGARVAEPGEFTKRAFLNGRLDLAQAEAVADLIRARSDRAAAAAVAQLEGSLSRRINALYDALLETAANVEATLDFSDQEIPADVLNPVTDNLIRTIDGLHALLSTWTEGHLLREGATVVIAGKPNVGKSTLLNALLGRNRAIVSPQPGTTRDTIEESLVLGGYPVTLIDTAGLRETDCAIEQEGITRATRELADADLCLYVVDAQHGPDEEDLRVISTIPKDKLIIVCNKSDLNLSGNIFTNNYCTTIYTSSTSGFGLDDLRKAIIRKFDHDAPHPVQHATISTRHRALIETAIQAAESALAEMKKESGALDLAAAQLREAVECIGSITGRVFHDDLLGSVFGRFCIGK